MTSPFADLARPPLRAAALRRALVDGDGLWTSLDVVTDTGSTNADLARAAAGGAPEGSVQWIFSDGLASVSLFVEPYDRQRHLQEGVVMTAGATQTLTRRLQDWWLTVVGEVPPQTLKAFAQSLERRK